MTSSSELGSAVRAARSGILTAATQTAMEKSLLVDMPQHQRALRRPYFPMRRVYSIKTEVNYETGVGGDRDPGAGSKCICGRTVRIPANNPFGSRVHALGRHDRTRRYRWRPLPGRVHIRQWLRSGIVRHLEQRLEDPDFCRPRQEDI